MFIVWSKQFLNNNRLEIVVVVGLTKDSLSYFAFLGKMTITIALKNIVCILHFITSFSTFISACERKQ